MSKCWIVESNDICCELTHKVFLDEEKAAQYAEKWFREQCADAGIEGEELTDLIKQQSWDYLEDIEDNEFYVRVDEGEIVD